MPASDPAPAPVPATAPSCRNCRHAFASLLRRANEHTQLLPEQRYERYVIDCEMGRWSGVVSFDSFFGKQKDNRRKAADCPHFQPGEPDLTCTRQGS